MIFIRRKWIRKSLLIKELRHFYFFPTKHIFDKREQQFTNGTENYFNLIVTRSQFHDHARKFSRSSGGNSEATRRFPAFQTWACTFLTWSTRGRVYPQRFWLRWPFLRLLRSHIDGRDPEEVDNAPIGPTKWISRLHTIGHAWRSLCICDAIWPPCQLISSGHELFENSYVLATKHGFYLLSFRSKIVNGFLPVIRICWFKIREFKQLNFLIKSKQVFYLTLFSEYWIYFKNIYICFLNN